MVIFTASNSDYAQAVYENVDENKTLFKKVFHKQVIYFIVFKVLFTFFVNKLAVYKNIDKKSLIVSYLYMLLNPKYYSVFSLLRDQYKKTSLFSTIIKSIYFILELNFKKKYIMFYNLIIQYFSSQ